MKPTVPDTRIRIDPEFAKLLPAHTAEERAGLEQSLLQERVCRDPLVVWKGHGTLLDGHLRYELCRTHSIPIRVHELDLPNREAAIAWIIQNQLSRRNLPPLHASYLRGKLYLGEKQGHGGDRKGGGSSCQGDNLKTAEKVAAELNVSPRTILRDAAFAKAVDRITKSCGQQVKQAILSGEAGLKKNEVLELAELPPEEQPQALQLAQQGKRAWTREPQAFPFTVRDVPKEAAHAVFERAEPQPEEQPQAFQEPAQQGKGARPPEPQASSTTFISPAEISIPTEPEEAARALVKKLGRAKATKVHKALGKVLKERKPEGGGKAGRSKRRSGRKAKATP
jgi:hypothetical protein